MKKEQNATLSTMYTSELKQTRLTMSMFQTLLFIHRFSHVTTFHIMSRLEHAHSATSNQLLTRLRAKGLIDRHYTSSDEAANRYASYYLTPAGLAALTQKFPTMRLRSLRSIDADGTATLPRRMRHHALLDVYMYFKRHYNGHFQLSSAHDLAGINNLPDEMPDGYLQLTLPGMPPKAYFVELFGWGRASHVQRRRLSSYLHYFESTNVRLNDIAGVFIVTANSKAQARLQATLQLALEASFIEDTMFYTTSLDKLSSERDAIWKAV